MVNALPTLWVDYRDGSIDLLEPLQEMGLPAVKGDFDADIKFTGRGEKGAPVEIGVEFKKLGELIQSLQTQRLQGHQLLKMRKAFDFSYLLIEGELMWNSQGVLTKWSRGAYSGRGQVPVPGRMRANELLKRIHVLHLRGGLNPLWSRNRTDTLKQIEVLYRVWTDQDLDEHKSHLAIYQAPQLMEVSQFRKTVHTLPEVGMKVSSAAETKFNSSLRKAICLSTTNDWATIETRDKNGNTKRLGEKTAKKIMEAIR